MILWSNLTSSDLFIFGLVNEALLKEVCFLTCFLSCGGVNFFVILATLLLDPVTLWFESGAAEDGVGGAELDVAGTDGGTAETGVLVSLTAPLNSGTASIFSIMIIIIFRIIFLINTNIYEH